MLLHMGFIFQLQKTVCSFELPQSIQCRKAREGLGVMLIQVVKIQSSHPLALFGEAAQAGLGQSWLGMDFIQGKSSWSRNRGGTEQIYS